MPMVGADVVDFRGVPPGFGWIATISKPILQSGIKLTKWSYKIWSQP